MPFVQQQFLVGYIVISVFVCSVGVKTNKNGKVAVAVKAPLTDVNVQTTNTTSKTVVKVRAAAFYQNTWIMFDEVTYNACHRVWTESSRLQHNKRKLQRPQQM